MRRLPLWLSLALVPTSALAKDPCANVTQKLLPAGLELWAELSTCTEATFTVSADETNVVNQLPSIVDAAGRTRFLLARWRRVDGDSPWSVKNWKYRFKVGRRLTSAPATPEGTWRFPFKGHRKVLQGPRGSFSHQAGSEDEEAWDWAMPEGTEIIAARAGQVVAVRSECTEGGVDDALREEANYVILRHDDGLFSQYNHLQVDGPTVKLGDRVQQGQLIGRSGNTGYTSTPHLHFAAFFTIDGTTRRTVPVSFAGSEGSTAPDRAAQEPPVKPVPPTDRREQRLKRATDDAVKAIEAIGE
jgi:murein DD-endopeptidase MepM/ murein hydrolase activator NlpD